MPLTLLHAIMCHQIHCCLLSQVIHKTYLRAMIPHMSHMSAYYRRTIINIDLVEAHKKTEKRICAQQIGFGLPDTGSGLIRADYVGRILRQFKGLNILVRCKVVCVLLLLMLCKWRWCNVKLPDSAECTPGRLLKPQ